MEVHYILAPLSFSTAFLPLRIFFTCAVCRRQVLTFLCCKCTIGKASACGEPVMANLRRRSIWHKSAMASAQQAARPSVPDERSFSFLRLDSRAYPSVSRDCHEYSHFFRTRCRTGDSLLYTHFEHRLKQHCNKSFGFAFGTCDSLSSSRLQQNTARQPPAAQLSNFLPPERRCFR